MRAGKHLVFGIIALLALGGVFTQRAFAFPHKRHAPKSHYSHYKIGKNADFVGGKFKAPKKQHLPKSSYGKK